MFFICPLSVLRPPSPETMILNRFRPPWPNLSRFFKFWPALSIHLHAAHRVCSPSAGLILEIPPRPTTSWCASKRSVPPSHSWFFGVGFLLRSAHSFRQLSIPNPHLRPPRMAPASQPVVSICFFFNLQIPRFFLIFFPFLLFF